METDWLILLKGCFPQIILTMIGGLMALQYVTGADSSLVLFFVILLDIDKMDSGKDNFATV